MSTLPYGLEWEGEERREVEFVVIPEEKNLIGPGKSLQICRFCVVRS